MAPTPAARRQARRALDSRLAEWRSPAGREASARPNGGWVRAIREALGLSTADLASRLGVASSTANRFERNERAGTIQLDSLARVADALGCDLVYVLVPRRRLEEAVDGRARELAERELAAVEHTMLLEGQPLRPQFHDERLGELAEQIKSRPGLWRD